jgi:hypothetical protein
MKQELSKRLQFMVAIPVLVALIIIGLPLAGCVYVLWWLYGMTIHVLVWGCWCMRGIHVIVVYSDSPVWHDYIDEKMIPRLPENTIILNWSECRTWQWYPLRVQVFHYFGGKRHFNPLVLVFHPLRRTGTFRFWQAFRDYKHGNSQPLHEMEQRMFKAVAKTGNTLPGKRSRP